MMRGGLNDSVVWQIQAPMLVHAATAQRICPNNNQGNQDVSLVGQDLVLSQDRVIRSRLHRYKLDNLQPAGSAAATQCHPSAAQH